MKNIGTLFYFFLKKLGKKKKKKKIDIKLKKIMAIF